MVTSLIILLIYIAYIVYKYGFPHSLSETHYLTGHKIWFSLVLVVSTVLVLPTMLEITPENILFLPFLAMSGVLLVAFTPDYKDDTLIDKVHTVSALISIILSLVWVYLLNPINLLFWSLIILYIGYKYLQYRNLYSVFIYSNIKFWAEIIMLLTVYLSIK